MTEVVEIKGLEEIRKALREAGRAGDHAMGAALYQEGLDIMKVSYRLCPVDVGRLRATAYTSPPDLGGFLGPFVELGYGTDYALAVHERTEVAHNPPTQAKYLEQPLREAKIGYVERIAREAKKNLDSGLAFGGR